MPDPGGLPTLQVFGWGCLGGGIVALVLYVLPELGKDLASSAVHLTKRKILVMSVMALVLAGVAGALALVPASISNRGAAIEAGLGIQATLRGILGAVQQGIKPTTTGQ
jgi:hypothetical protein